MKINGSCTGVPSVAFICCNVIHSGIGLDKTWSGSLAHRTQLDVVGRFALDNEAYRARGRLVLL